MMVIIRMKRRRKMAKMMIRIMVILKTHANEVRIHGDDGDDGDDGKVAS